MLTRGDLHIHSTASDGELSPGEIVLSAKQLGVDTIAIADHNSTDGISEAAAAGSQLGVSVIPAVEISTKYRGESIHILGYFKDSRYNQEPFQEILKLIKAHSIKEVRKILKGFMSTDGSGDHLSIPEGICLLKTFGASVVLAHPIRISMKNLPFILKQPFDGLEAKYCSNSSYDTCFFINMALSRFSFYSGGSDFHTNKSGPQVHCSIGEPSLNKTELQKFLSNSGAAVLS